MNRRPWKIALALAALAAGCGEDPAKPPAGDTAPASPDKPAAPDNPIEPKAAGAPAEPVGEKPDASLLAARDDLAANRLDAALAKLDALLKDKPDDRRALVLYVQATQSKGADLALRGGDRKGATAVFEKSVEAVRSLIKAGGELSGNEKQLIAMALYNQACSLAIEGKADPAMGALKEAIDRGFQEKDTFATDAELDSLRGRPDFDELYAKLGIKKPLSVAEKMKENKPFPFSLSLTDFEGKPLTTEELKGKVAIVDFWGTWCPPCREELPVLASLYQKYKDKGLEIVGVNCGEQEGPQAKAKIVKFLSENVPYRCALTDGKAEAQVPDFEGFPTTLFLDRTGTVRLKMVGFDPAHKSDLEDAVKLLLDEK